MKTYRQWVCWRLVDRGGEKPTKIPFNPATGAMASVTDPHTWATFDEAVAAAPSYNGIGFVLTKADPYTFIDLDDTAGNQANLDRQLRIFKEFDSYSERSPSGTGLHIIVRGHVPNGRRRASVELYSTERYMTMTGVVFRDKPIMERQQLCQTLWAEMGGEANAAPVHDGNAPQTIDDAEVIRRALAAVNGEKFKLLLEGNWRELYPSQSEADIAFTNIIAFYTQNTAQIVRIFHASPLGQRDKAKRPGYLDGLIRRAYDQLLPPVDIQGLDMAWRAPQLETESISGGTPAPALNSGTLPENAIIGPHAELLALWQPKPIGLPRGLMGEIAQFIYQASPRPVKETAIAAAIGLTAGITGRAYNISGTGLNLYVLLLALTGTGKEGMARGIAKLMEAIVGQCPAAADFRGPSQFASGQALIRQLATKNPCFLSIIGEFGLKMQQLASPRASNSEIFLKQVLLELFNKSGASDVLDPAVFADKDKNIAAIKRPAVSILGESTPETFYKVIDESLIADGLLPRFLILEYNGDRPRRNKHHHHVKPSITLVEQLVELCAYSLTLQQNDSVINVEMTPEAEQFLDELDELVDDTINATKTDTLRHLWNRAHIKTLKLAAQVAVGADKISPRITLEDAQWAYNIVCTDITGIVRRFSAGEIGRSNEENKQGWWILKACKEYLTQPYESLAGYRIDKRMHEAHIVTMSFISRRLIACAAFKNERMTASDCIKRAVAALIENGDIEEVGKNELNSRFSFKGRAFTIQSPERLAMSMGEDPDERRGRNKKAKE